ncbi:VOC family protein [Aurantibacter sp.]|uniref:VOC family protein n=1 Tax=Aurantibacter sp. TaxID=2807103 RepID=UPI003265B99B
MRFKKLKLYTNKLESEFDFYSKKLGFKIIERTDNSFIVKAGWTHLEFQKSVTEHKYHYCFLIPWNHLNQALKWFENRVEIIKIENNSAIIKFEFWNAESFYFYDASGNLAEIIVHYDLKNAKNEFNALSILGLCEIGMPTTNIQKVDTQLNAAINSKFWKGDFERFGTNGTIEAKFLLPNYEIKETWFPTSLKIKPQPFETLLENNGNEYHLEFKEGVIKTTVIKL